MILKIKGRKTLVIYDCPGEYDEMQIHIEYGPGWGIATPVKSATINWIGHEPKTTILNRQDAFVISGLVTDEMYLKYSLLDARKILGFVPLFDAEQKFRADLNFIDAEDLKSRIKPTIMENFLGVQVPKVFVDMMSTQSALGETFTNSKIEIADFPEHLQQHAVSAIKKLNGLGPGKKYKTEDARVYDFLGLLDLFVMHRVFIHGDILLCPEKINDLVLAGDLNPKIYVFSLYKLSGYSIPSTIIEVTQEYQTLVRTGGYKLEEYEFQAMILYRERYLLKSKQ